LSFATARSNATTVDEELKFQAGLLDAVEQSVIATDLDGTILYWNRFAETVYGWSSVEALGRNVGELLVPEASAEQAQAIMARLRLGQSWSGEFVVHRRDGTSFLSLVTDSPIRDSSGALVGVIGISIDIDARKRAEDAQARLAAIVTSSDDAIIAMRLDGTITDWNRGAVRLRRCRNDRSVDIAADAARAGRAGRRASRPHRARRTL
jgi:PAS domain S-box-containing protein